jgi:hypothetical protein
MKHFAIAASLVCVLSAPVLAEDLDRFIDAIAGWQLPLIAADMIPVPISSCRCSNCATPLFGTRSQFSAVYPLLLIV